MIADDRPPLRYVALGDSYTIGTGVDPAATWPSQLAEALASRGDRMGPWSSWPTSASTAARPASCDATQLPELDRLRPGFASLLIGVNDVVRGTAAGPYEANLRAILEALLARLARNRILTVAIPDYTATPRGAGYGDPAQRSSEIAAFNAIMSRLSSEHGVRHVDISTCRCERPPTGRGSRRTGSIPVPPNTVCGWSGSRRSWRASSLEGRRELSDRPA